MFTVLFYRIEVSTGSISQNAVCKLCFSPVHISVRSWFHTVFIQTHVACGCLLAWVLLRTLLHCFFFFFLWCFKYIDFNCIFWGAAEVLYQWMEERWDRVGMLRFILCSGDAFPTSACTAQLGAQLCEVAWSWPYLSQAKAVVSAACFTMVLADVT